MKQLSLEAKENIVLQVLNRGSETIESIAQANNVGISSLHKWVRRYREGLPINKNANKSSKLKLSQAEKFNHILATARLDELSLGKYCREKGLYSHQLIEWREEFMKSPESKKDLKNQSELKTLKDENKRLKQELRRKEKALAEASALLILKKKADLIWGDKEED